MSQKKYKILKRILRVISIIAIAIYAYSLTPKVFQNDTLYTIKRGETITQDTEHIYDLFPWSEGLDMKDHYSYHNLPYTYPHWLYDYLTYQIYNIGNFKGIYIITCILAVVMGLLIYFVNLKLNKNDIISFFITIGSLYCLKNFITARAQLVTFILFILEVFGIEQFIRTKKFRYVILLVVIPILIASLHCAVWPFTFVIDIPYTLEYVIIACASINYGVTFRRIKLFLKRKMNKINKQQLDAENNKIEEMRKNYREKVDRNLSKTYKLELAKQENIKWLILVFVICIFTGFLTPIKLTPYTYLIKTTEGNTTQNINEHLPLTLIKNEDMIVIVVLIFGVLIFSKSKITLRDFFMIMGLIALSFISQRQVSMLVLIGNFILARMLCNVLQNIKNSFNIKNDVNTDKGFLCVKWIVVSSCIGLHDVCL